MPKSKNFYLFAVGLGVFILGTAVGKIFFSNSPVKTVSPTAISQPVVEETPIVEEKAIIPANEKPQDIEKDIPSVVGEEPIENERPLLTEEVSVKVEIPKIEGNKEEQPVKLEFQRGMVYVAWTENGYSNASSVKSMEELVSSGVDWAGLVATWYQGQPNTTEIYPIKDKTPSDNSLVFAIRKLHELKIKVMLKPHLDLVEANGKWRGEIGFGSDQEWQVWFENYAKFILHYANIAAQEDVKLFCIGTELTLATTTHPKQWRELIGKIREIYKGQLTYAANWNEEFDQIEFWDALDYAGIDPYFPLVCTMRPKVEELKSAWVDWLKVIEAWQKKINKPVIFAEIGYKSSRDATDEPWQHTAIGELDLEIQSNCYKAILESFWDKPWFYGIYWWYWGVNPNMGGKLNRGFILQNKPAQEVVKEWYNKPISGKAY